MIPCSCVLQIARLRNETPPEQAREHRSAGLTQGSPRWPGLYSTIRKGHWYPGSFPIGLVHLSKFVFDDLFDASELGPQFGVGCHAAIKLHPWLGIGFRRRSGEFLSKCFRDELFHKHTPAGSRGFDTAKQFIRQLEGCLHLKYLTIFMGKWQWKCEKVEGTGGGKVSHRKSAGSRVRQTCAAGLWVGC